jgi:hypothetical protein
MEPGPSLGIVFGQNMPVAHTALACAHVLL